MRKKIVEHIKKYGPITFELFMSMALYDPEFGYYNTETGRIGREGDFYTSSHLHPVFGAMMGRQINEMWDLMGQPENFRIVEMGGGEGYFCKDLLDSLRAANKAADFFGSLKYTIIERSPVLRNKQQGILSDYPGKIEWRSELLDCGGVTGCIFSNELLDAFPVHLVRMEEVLKEIYLDFDDEKGFMEISGDLSSEEIMAYFKDFSIKIREGYTTEVNLRIRDWLREINEVLDRGFILTIDYGYPAWDYYSEERDRGTILCYHRHQMNENPYLNIGQQDITAHVNYSALKKWGEDMGIKTDGFCGQGVFMVSLGIDEEIKKITECTEEYVFDIAKIKKLILPQGMGESHKVMIQHKGVESSKLRGFSIRNQLKTL